MANSYEPWANIRSVSTTSAAAIGKIKRPRRAKDPRRRQATPHRLAATSGPRTPVTLTLRLRTGADAWLEVITDQGRFFCSFDVSAFALVEQVIRGGHWVETLSGPLLAEHKRGVAWLHLQQSHRSSGEPAIGDGCPTPTETSSSEQS